MEDAGISQTTTDPSDELTLWVREALQWVWRGKSLEDLEEQYECPKAELEGVLDGTRSVSPQAARYVANAIGCFAQDIEEFALMPILEWLDDLPPSVQPQVND
jgi:hypothetical protein